MPRCQAQHQQGNNIQEGSLTLQLKGRLTDMFSLNHLATNAERTRGNCIAVDVAAAEGRKCRDLLAESTDKGNAKT